MAVIVTDAEDTSFYRGKINRGHGENEVVYSVYLQDLVADSYIQGCGGKKKKKGRFLNGRKTMLLHSLQTSLREFLALCVLKNGFNLCKKWKSEFTILVYTGHQHCFFSLLCFKDCNAVNVGGKEKQNKTYIQNQAWNVFEIVNNSKGKNEIRLFFLHKPVVSDGLKVVVKLGQGSVPKCPSLPSTVPILAPEVCILRRQEVLIFGYGCKRFWEVQNPKAAQKTGAESNTNFSVKWILHRLSPSCTHCLF